MDKLYDEAGTPYQGLMEHMAEGRRKERLKAFHESLAPIELTSKVKQCRAKILPLLQRCSAIESA